MEYDIMFTNPSLEEHFRKAIKKAGDSEIGGWFCVQYKDPSFWICKPFRWNPLRLAIGEESASWIAFIIGWVLITNKATDPERGWRPWDMLKAKDTAITTAHSYGAHALHFHSHPQGLAFPSDGDKVFYAEQCTILPGKAEGVIVTANPLRLWPMQLSWECPGSSLNDSQVKIDRGHYYTWRSKGLRELSHV